MIDVKNKLTKHAPENQPSTRNAGFEQAYMILSERGTLCAEEAYECGFVREVVSAGNCFRMVESRVEKLLKSQLQQDDSWALVREAKFAPRCEGNGDGDGKEKAKFVLDQEITTLMIRNIPKTFTSQLLANLIIDLGFGGKYDFTYVPSAGNRYQKVKGALGYGFVNFTDPADAQDFYEAFHNHHIKSARKPCSVEASKTQGRRKILKIMGKSRAPFMDPSHLPVL